MKPRHSGAHRSASANSELKRKEDVSFAGMLESESESPAKKRKLRLDEEDSDNSDGDRNGNVAEASQKASQLPIDKLGFKINEDYAKRFEHNKKREELHRLQEKYGQGNGTHVSRSRTEEQGDIGDSNNSSSDSDEEEDDEGVLATDTLDAEILATLAAIKSKDPRVYDKNIEFYSELNTEVSMESSKREKPMYLRDYHRINLLHGQAHDEDGVQQSAPKTYAQQQDDLKRNLVREMHLAVEEEAVPSGATEDLSADEDVDFFTAKQKPESEAVEPSRLHLAQPDDMLAIADKDPESFLTKYMSSRAWVPTANSRFQPFESDDEEEDQRAEEFENAFNLRFEDPETSNEKLKLHARDTAARYSVRRDEPKGRKRARELERERKEAENREREEEKTRLRRLRIEEAERKVQKIKEAAGLRGAQVREEEWIGFLDEVWDMEKWEEEMQKRFGEAYYAEKEEVGSGANSGQSKKVKKPKWDDDIDISDLVPDFDQGNSNRKLQLELSEDERQSPGPHLDQDEEEANMAEFSKINGKRKNKKSRAREHAENKGAARRERRRIEELVDAKLEPASFPQLPSSSGMQTRGFRYRETSPSTFGLTPQDILMASDSQLNQYVGLKKLAAFRDAEKKRKDKKRLGKKARLRQWRRETFGDVAGPAMGRNGELPIQPPTKNGIENFDGREAVEKRQGKKRKRKSAEQAAQ